MRSSSEPRRSRGARPSLVLRAALALVVLLARADASRAGRVLRHESCSDVAAAAAAGGAKNPCATTVVGGGTLVRECAFSRHTYYHDRGQLLDAAAANLQPTARECCRSCFDTPLCSVWTWCGADDEEGCAPPPPAPGGPAPPRVPRGGCALLALGAFHSVANDTSAFRATDPALAFWSGTPVSLHLPPAAGYDLHPSSDLNNARDYECAMSTAAGRCAVAGSPGEVGNMCDADPRCAGFVFVSADTGLVPCSLGVLKARGPAGEGLDDGMFTVNPSTAVYALSGLPQPAGAAAAASGGGGGGVSTLWIAVLAALAAALAIVAALAIFVAARSSQLGRAARAAGAQKTAPGGSPAPSASPAPGSGAGSDTGGSAAELLG